MEHYSAIKRKEVLINTTAWTLKTSCFWNDRHQKTIYNSILGETSRISKFIQAKVRNNQGLLGKKEWDCLMIKVWSNEKALEIAVMFA